MKIGSFERLAVSARRPKGPICIGPEAEPLRRFKGCAVVVSYTGVAACLVEGMVNGLDERATVSERRPQGPICIGPEAETCGGLNREF